MDLNKKKSVYVQQRNGIRSLPLNEMENHKNGIRFIKKKLYKAHL